MSDAAQPAPSRPEVSQPAPEQPDAVQRDDDLIERLRRAVTTDAVVWGDDEPEDDPAIAALLAVLRDVTGMPPVELAPLAAVLPLRRRRGLVRGSAVAACALGLLSVAGVAAASPGSPLYAVRTAIDSAVRSVVDVVSPSGPTAAASRSLPSLQFRPSPTPTAPHLPVLPAVSTPATTAAAPAAGTVEAARLVAALLDRAQVHLSAGRYVPAGRLLDLAEQRLPEVAVQDGRTGLAARLAALRAVADAGAVARTRPPTVHRTDPPASPGVKQRRAPATKHPKPSPPATPRPGHGSGGRPTDPAVPRRPHR